MRTMATSSSLNPNAPLFVPAAFRRVEDFSPQWWELVKTTAWFRDHWFRQHQELEQQEPPPFDDVASLLPDSVDLLDIDSDHLFHNHHQQEQAVFNPDEVTKKMSLNSPTEGAARVLGEQPRYYEKLAQHVSPTGAFIHQPR